MNVLDTPPVLGDAVNRFQKMCEENRALENCFTQKPEKTQFSSSCPQLQSQQQLPQPQQGPLSHSSPPGQWSQDHQLPPNWLARVDPKTGRTYYANTVTKTTQWEFPQESQSCVQPQFAYKSMSQPYCKQQLSQSTSQPMQHY